MQPLIGTWRSYMSFYCKGKKEMHTPSHFWEITLTQQGLLCFRGYPSSQEPLLLHKGTCRLREEKGRQYLYAGNSLLNEAGSGEKDARVRQDSRENRFFAARIRWDNRLHPERNT